MATIKQKEFVKELARSKNATEAAMKVYKPKTKNSARVIACKNLKTPTIQKLMERMGLRDKDLLKALQDALQANKTYLTKDRELIQPDYYTRLKTAELGFKLKGYLQDRISTTQVPAEIKVQFIRVDSKGKKTLLHSV